MKEISLDVKLIAGNYWIKSEKLLWLAALISMLIKKQFFRGDGGIVQNMEFE